jgi:hypothetical protein
LGADIIAPTSFMRVGNILESRSRQRGAREHRDCLSQRIFIQIHVHENRLEYPTTSIRSVRDDCLPAGRILLQLSSGGEGDPSFARLQERRCVLDRPILMYTIEIGLLDGI